ncbi:MAG: NAD(P)/FAD-dependent oxidoreductase [Vicinamibacterales bacterium]
MDRADDVVVVGGGPAGALAALLLARRGYRVRVFERARFPRPKLCGDTLNPGALATLARHADTGPLLARGRPLHGMRLSGTGGPAVEARYPRGLAGLTIVRRDLDDALLRQAAAAGAAIEDGVLVRGAAPGAGVVDGVIVATARGDRRHQARLVVGADGRTSALAGGLGLAWTPRRPRRWAFGTYAEGVDGTAPDLGEMHVRRGRYLGLAPVADGVTNVCVVVPRAAAARFTSSPWEALRAALADDPVLSARLAGARPVARVVSLGPMAREIRAAGVPGLLLAGDAAGFIDPMTGDGLRLAIDGAVLAADLAAEVLEGRVSRHRASDALTRRRTRAFAAKWRFNRTVRRLVDAPAAVRAAVGLAEVWPGLAQALVGYAGDLALA